MFCVDKKTILYLQKFVKILDMAFSLFIRCFLDYNFD